MSINCKPIIVSISGSGLFVIPEGFQADVLICEGLTDLKINGASIILGNVINLSSPSMQNMSLKENDIIEGGVYVLSLYEM